MTRRPAPDALGRAPTWAPAADAGAPAGKLVAWVGDHLELDLSLVPPLGGSFGVDPMAAAIEMLNAVIPQL